MTSESKTEAKLTVLTALTLCECGCVNLTVGRDGIDILSHGGTVVYTCKHCGAQTPIRAASERRAQELLPDLLPGPKTEVWVHRYDAEAPPGKAKS